MITIRRSRPDDADALRRLAERDSAVALDGEILLAISSGEDRPVAALSLTDRRAIADPFVPSADAVALLELRARQLRGSSAGLVHRVELLAAKASQLLGSPRRQADLDLS